MDNSSTIKQPGRLILLLIFIVFVATSLVFIVRSNIENLNLYKPLAPENSIGIDEAIRMGKQDLEHEILLFMIREDLRIPRNLEVKIMIGPYSNIVDEGEFIYSTHPFILLVLLNESFYQNLNSDEKIALISHELGHLVNGVIFLSYTSDTMIRLQIEADTYATKYINAEAMISVLNKANNKHGGFLSRQHYLRIQNLEKIKGLKQGY